MPSLISTLTKEMFELTGAHCVCSILIFRCIFVFLQSQGLLEIFCGGGEGGGGSSVHKSMSMMQAIKPIHLRENVHAKTFGDQLSQHFNLILLYTTVPTALSILLLILRPCDGPTNSRIPIRYLEKTILAHDVLILL